MSEALKVAVEQAETEIALEQATTEAEIAVTAAEAAIALAETQAAVVVADAAETIEESVQIVEENEEELSWMRTRLASLETVMAEMVVSQGLILSTLQALEQRLPQERIVETPQSVEVDRQEAVTEIVTEVVPETVVQPPEDAPRKTRVRPRL